VEGENELAQSERRIPNFGKFSVPKPSMEQGILDPINIVQNTFTINVLKDGLVRSFTKTGKIPVNDANSKVSPFVEYATKSTSGSIQVRKDSKFVDLSSRKLEY
jgi:hypothetical protein